uniref:Protein SSUH2-like protein n=1 Tax=Parascaris univalens TaxID=6257 RepID=A0A915ABL3_PARUN
SLSSLLVDCDRRASWSFHSTMADTKQTHFELVPPPSENTVEHHQNFDRMPTDHYFDDTRQISEEEVREALSREAKRHKYWQSNAAKKMIIEKIQNSACFHYTLESFTETRSTSKATEGVSLGQFLEHQNAAGSSGLSFNPWDYEMEPVEEFVDQVKVIEMPGSSELITCNSCNAEGLTHCFYCRGYGTDKCTYCRGTGMKAGVAHPAVYTHPMIGTFPHSDLSRGYPGSGTAVVRPTSGGLAYGVGTPIHFMAKAGVPPPGIGHHDFCYFCHGRGISECSHCKGHGKKPCSACGGSGSLRSYTKLRIYFAVERSDYYTQCEIPEKLLQKVSGYTVLSECQPYKHPIMEINENSRRICALHLQKCLGTCRVIKQRQCLVAIPIARVQFRFGSRCGFFWVYGTELRCYVPNYPAKCSIL